MKAFLNIQARRVNPIHRIAAAVAEEVSVPAAEAKRIALEEATKARIIEPVPVIVDCCFFVVLAALEEEPRVPRRSVGPHIAACVHGMGSCMAWGRMAWGRV